MDAMQNSTEQKILILYEEKIKYLGDFCIRFDKISFCKSFFNASIDINFTNKENKKYYEALLINNPNLAAVSDLEWENIEFDNYDLVFCAAYDENRLKEFICKKYNYNAGERFVVFSISEVLLAPDPNAVRVFPVNSDFMAQVQLIARHPGLLYVSEEEREWGNRWLESRGLKQGEELFIFLDSTTKRSKLINIQVYFEVLQFVLNRAKVKVLIFDEKSIGKEEFYRQWLGEEQAEKLIFSKGLELREDLRIIASSFTRLIFGPCTGLMHCASGIYNYYVQSGKSLKEVPLMITYTGQYPKEENNADLWWGSSPLVQCLLLQKRNNETKLALLSALSEAEKISEEQVPCSEYTSRMLIDFLDGQLKLRNETPK